MNSGPPRLAKLILWLLTEPEDRRFVLSDAEEEFEACAAVEGEQNARRAYWSQALRSSGPLLTRRLLRERRLPGKAGLGGGMIETSCQDIRFALRTLAKAPGFFAISLTTLALGISVNTAAFSLVNSVLLQPVPFEDADGLVEIWAEGSPMGAAVTTSPQPEMLQAWFDQAESFAAIGLFDETELTFSGGEEPSLLQGATMSPNLLRLLRVNPRLGRGFIDADLEPGDEQSVLLSESFWQQQFGADPSIVGRALTLDGTPRTVVGVVPSEMTRLFDARFFVGQSKAVWLPLSRHSIQEWEDSPFVLARLEPGVTLGEAQAELDVIQAGLTAAGLNEDGWSPFIERPNGMLGGRVVTVLWVLFGSVTMVLLIGCANIANMLLARGVAREHEFAIRSALGASKARLTRQLLIEGLLLSLAGGLIGIALTYWALDGIIALAANNLRELRSVRIDPIVLVFTLCLSLLTATIFALAPAVQLKLAGMAEALRSGRGSGTSHSRGNWLRQTLVVFEVAMALALFLGAALLINSFVHLNRVDPGFDPEAVVALEVNLPEARYPNESTRAEFFETVENRMERLPTTRSVAVARGLPPDVPWLFGTVEVVGREDVEDTSPLKAGNWISNDYLRTIGATLKEGRDFNDLDQRSEAGPIIVNEALARKFWPSGGALGSQIRLDLPFQAAEVGEHTVVGVVHTVKAFGLDDEADRMQIYFPVGENGLREGFFVARAAGDPSVLIPLLKQQIWAVDPGLPITKIAHLDQELSNDIARPRFNTLLLSSFAVLALFLATIGVYGVTSFAAAQRTREIGVRVALGAERSDIVRLMVARGMKPILMGILLGLGAAWALSRFLRSILFEIEPNDPATFAFVATFLTLVGIAACYLPSCRATRVDPVEVLRQE